VLGFAAFAFLAVFPVSSVAAAAAAVVAAGLGAVVAVRTATTVAVTGGELSAGAAHIPLRLLGPGTVLDRDGIRAALGPGSDARAFACLRSWIPTAVVVEVRDPADPTPTWLISTRRPAQLLAALDAGRDQSQAAHSEQII
jgi:hypothetical protein